VELPTNNFDHCRIVGYFCWNQAALAGGSTNCEGEASNGMETLDFEILWKAFSREVFDLSGRGGGI